MALLRNSPWLLTAATLIVFETGAAQGGICDWRPSAMVSGNGTEVAAGATAATAAGLGGAAAAGGVGLKALGYYTLIHSTSGLTMLGSTAAGASAAGTAGIVAGSGGLIGTAASIAMAPATITAGAVAALGVGLLEGTCWFGDERITDFEEVLAILQSMAEQADLEFFRLDYDAALDGQAVYLRDPDTGEIKTYLVRNLYIVNGMLKHREWGLNSTIGRVSYVSGEDTTVETEADGN